MEAKDYYQTLGVNTDAGPEDVRKAFHAGVDITIEPTGPLTDFNLSPKVRH